MTKLHQVYKCNVCGNIVVVVHTGVGQLVCCNQPMALMEGNTVEAAKEKHIPVIKKQSGGLEATVGEVEHPMDKDHYIEWIDLIINGKLECRRYLKPGYKPTTSFKVDLSKGHKIEVRAYCNLHGLWVSK